MVGGKFFNNLDLSKCVNPLQDLKLKVKEVRV